MFIIRCLNSTLSEQHSCSQYCYLFNALESRYTLAISTTYTWIVQAIVPSNFKTRSEAKRLIHRLHMDWQRIRNSEKKRSRRDAFPRGEFVFKSNRILVVGESCVKAKSEMNVFC